MINDPRRGMRWRLAALLALALSLVLWRSCARPAEYVVQIEYGLDPARLVGTEVLIDGVVAGHLAPSGRATRSTFAVSEGDHVVTVRVPGCEAEPRRFTAGFGGVAVLLVASVVERSGTAETTCVVGWER